MCFLLSRFSTTKVHCYGEDLNRNAVDWAEIFSTLLGYTYAQSSLSGPGGAHLNFSSTTETTGVSLNVW